MKQSTESMPAATPAMELNPEAPIVQFGAERVSLGGVPVAALIAALEAAYGAHEALRQAAAYRPDRLNGRGTERRLRALAEEIRGLELAVRAARAAGRGPQTAT